MKLFEDMGIVHRDLKPENLIIKYQESPESPKLNECHIFVIDLGFAVDVSQKAVFKEGCGTVGYMAPENFKRDKDSKTPDTPISSKVDLYSLGIIFYELYAPLTQRLRSQPLQKRHY